MTSHSSGITVVIFARGEEATIGRIINEIKNCFTRGKVVAVITNKSIKTLEILKNYKISPIFDNGKGKGAAIRMAIELISSDILVFMDADGSHRPKEIPLLVEPILKNESDLVIASRLRGKSEELGNNLENIIRLLGNLLSSFLIKILWGKRGQFILDCQNGFRAIKADVARKLCLTSNTFAIEQEMVIRCLKKGYRIREIPSYEIKRKFGKSHINPFSMLFQYMYCFFNEIVRR
ncbi:MAG: glycosyltransferase family 2 protein [Candidatus Omnitrophota bacterium]